MKTPSIFFAVLLLFSVSQGCKSTSADPDLATTLVGTYKGKQIPTGDTPYASSVAIAKTSAKIIELTITDLTDNSVDAQIDNIAVSSATTFSGLYDPYGNGKGFDIDGTVSGNTLTMRVKYSGQVVLTFTGNK